MRLWDSPLFYWLPDVCRMDAHFLNVQLPIGVRLPGQPQARCEVLVNYKLFLHSWLISSHCATSTNVLDNLCCGKQRTDIIVFFILLFVFGADGLSGDSPGPFLFETKKLKNMATSNAVKAKKNVARKTLPVKELEKVWITTAEACDWLSCTRNLLDDLRENAEVAYAKIGGKVYYEVASIHLMFQRHRVGAKGEGIKSSAVCG